MSSPIIGYFVKVATFTFVTIAVLAILIGMALSSYSRATGARDSDGAFVCVPEDFFWIACASVAIGGIASAVRYLRRRP